MTCESSSLEARWPRPLSLSAANTGFIIRDTSLEHVWLVTWSPFRPVWLATVETAEDKEEISTYQVQHYYWLHSTKYWKDPLSNPDLVSPKLTNSLTRNLPKDHFFASRRSCLKCLKQIQNPTGCLRSSRASWCKIGYPQRTTVLSSQNSVNPFPMKKFICLKELQNQSVHRMVILSVGKEGRGWTVGFSYQEEI